MRSLKRYLITIGAGILATFAIVCLKDIFTVTEVAKIFHILTDAFFAVGVVMTGFGLLIYTSNEGVFDGLVYGVSTFLSMFKKDHKRKYETLFDYKESRADKKLGFGFLLISGLFFLAVSMIMLAIYSKYK
jgi:hypothetical protein